MLSAELDQKVRERAARRCEYCRMHQSLQGATFHIEHIVPVSRGGLTAPENLALACPSCNLQKSNKLTAPDPEAGVVPLFHPRLQKWKDHFEWLEYRVIGRTAVGRATIRALNLNAARRVEIRRAEELFRLFPPE
jgi:hypothetical protein